MEQRTIYGDVEKNCMNTNFQEILILVYGIWYYSNRTVLTAIYVYYSWQADSDSEGITEAKDVLKVGSICTVSTVRN